MSRSNFLKIGGHNAVVSYDPEIDMFRGEFMGLNGAADFYATNVRELKKEGSRSLHAFLTICAERGIEPEKRFSGTLNVRLGRKDHEAAAMVAAARGISLNALIAEAVRHEIAA